MLEFLSFILPRLPPLDVPIEADSRPRAVVYSDAMEAGQVGSREIRIGFVVLVVAEDGSIESCFHSHWEIPSEFVLSMFAADRRTYIAQAELLAAIVPYYSLPSVIRGRRVLHFIDNTVALSALVNGYASRPDLARMVNAFYVVQLALRCLVWFEWVPSKANIADLPSRLEYGEFFAALPLSVWVESVVPGFDSWLAPFEAFASFLFHVAGW